MIRAGITSVLLEGLRSQVIGPEVWRDEQQFLGLHDCDIGVEVDDCNTDLFGMSKLVALSFKVAQRSKFIPRNQDLSRRKLPQGATQEELCDIAHQC